MHGLGRSNHLENGNKSQQIVMALSAQVRFLQEVIAGACFIHSFAMHLLRRDFLGQRPVQSRPDISRKRLGYTIDCLECQHSASGCAGM